MNTRHLDAVLCDFDGTLAPNLDLPQMREEVIALTSTYDVPPEVYRDRYIVEIVDAAHAWLQESELAEAPAYFRAAHDLITTIELDAAADTAPFPGVTELLREWRGQGLKLGVVTRNCRRAVLNVFPSLLEYVDCLIARDDTPHLKPDPRHIEFCLGHLGCSPRRAVIIGDGALDMHVGAQLGMLRIGVLSGSSDADKLTQAGAHRVANHITEINL